jgi:heme/copper-type cytochrome/quinol oxidase subunit 2
VSAHTTPIIIQYTHKLSSHFIPIIFIYIIYSVIVIDIFIVIAIIFIKYHRRQVDAETPNANMVVKRITTNNIK